MIFHRCKFWCSAVSSTILKLPSLNSLLRIILFSILVSITCSSFATVSLSVIGNLSFSHAIGVDVVGNYAYLAAGSSGLKIIDISNPAAPSVVGSLAMGGIQDVKVVGNYAYIADHYGAGGGGLKIVDISNPSSPVLVGTEGTCINAFGVDVVGNYAYVADFSNLRIVDITNPASPVLVSSFGTSCLGSIKVVGNYAYLGDGNGGFKIVNISNLASPVLAGSLSMSYACGLSVVGNYAYVANLNAGLLDVINISNPASPVLSGSISMSNCVAVKVVGNYAYVLNVGSPGVIAAVDITNPAAPALAGSVNSGTGISANRLGLSVVGNHIYAGNNEAGFVVVQITGLSPTLSNVTMSGYENNPISFTSTDFSNHFSSSGGSLNKIKVASLPTNGSLKLSGVNVTVNQEITVGNISNLVYTPNVGYVGSDSFNWNGSDGTSYASSNAAVNINVADQPPILTNVTKTGYEDVTLSFVATDFSNNFSSQHILNKIKILSLPTNGTLKLSGVSVTINQEIMVSNLGNLTFIPSAGWTGTTSFNWNGSDGSLYAASSASVNISIVPQAPIVTTFSKDVCKDSDLSFASTDFSNNFTSYSGGLSQIQILSLPSNGVLKLSGIAVTTNQVISVANLSNLTFTPNTNWQGTASFSWNGSNGTSYAASSAIVNMNVGSSAPVLKNVAVTGVTNNNLAFIADDFASKFDGCSCGGNCLVKIKITSLPANGTLRLSDTSVAINQEISLNQIDNLIFIPRSGWIGSTSFGWNGSDGTNYAANNSLVMVTIGNGGNNNDWVWPVLGSIGGGGAAVAACAGAATAVAIGSYCLYKNGVFKAIRKVSQEIDPTPVPSSHNPEVKVDIELPAATQQQKPDINPV